MTEVYAFPPVAVQARYWTLEQPVGRSRSLITGASYVSAVQRKRIVAGFDIAGWPRYSSGYLEALWRYLDGGINLVRLQSCQIAHGNRAHGLGQTPFSWIIPTAPFEWDGPAGEFDWFTGLGLTFTVEPRNRVRVTSLPPNTIVAIPGDFVTVEVGGGRDTIMVVAEAVSNASGVAIIRLQRAASGSGSIGLGTRETGVFELVTSWPRVMNRLRFPENYALEFRQVFADERGPFVEIDPWS